MALSAVSVSPSDSLPTHLEEQRWNDLILTTPVKKPVLKIWTYSQAAVVLGCSQKKYLEQNKKGLKEDIDIIIRKSGGGAVLVGPWLVSVSVALPVGHIYTQNGPVSSFQWLGEVFKSLLDEMGLLSDLIEPGHENKSKKLIKNTSVKSEVDWACFGSLSSWELTLKKKKVVGLAQVRRQTGTLLVGGLLVSKPKWSLLCSSLEASSKDVERLREITTYCDEHLINKTLTEDVVNNLEAKINERFDKPLYLPG